MGRLSDGGVWATAATTAEEMYQGLHVKVQDGREGVIRQLSPANMCSVQLGARCALPRSCLQPLQKAKS